MFDKIMNWGGSWNPESPWFKLSYYAASYFQECYPTPPNPPTTRTPTHPTFFNGFDVVGETLTDIYMAIL